MTFADDRVPIGPYRVVRAGASATFGRVPVWTTLSKHRTATRALWAFALIPWADRDNVFVVDAADRRLGPDGYRLPVTPGI